MRECGLAPTHTHASDVSRSSSLPASGILVYPFSPASLDHLPVLLDSFKARTRTPRFLRMRRKEWGETNEEERGRERCQQPVAVSIHDVVGGCCIYCKGYIAAGLRNRRPPTAHRWCISSVTARSAVFCLWFYITGIAENP